MYLQVVADILTNLKSKLTSYQACLFLNSCHTDPICLSTKIHFNLLTVAVKCSLYSSDVSLYRSGVCIHRRPLPAAAILASCYVLYQCRYWSANHLPARFVSANRNCCCLLSITTLSHTDPLS